MKTVNAFSNFFKKKVHIGNIIKQVVETKNIRQKDLAEALCCNRQNLHNIYNRSDMNIEQLISISEKLGYNFLKEYLPERYLVILEVDNENLQRLLNDNQIRVIDTFKV